MVVEQVTASIGNITLCRTENEKTTPRRKRDASSLVANVTADEDRMRELREEFGMDLTRCAKSMPHLEGKDKQTLGDLIKPRSGTTDYKETVEAHRRLMQFISDNNIDRMDVGQIPSVWDTSRRAGR